MTNKISWKQLIPGCAAGNILELYDFILYAYFSSIIGHLFFPIDDSFLSTLLAFSVFAMGCLMRPLGSLLFGLVGDRLGRKKALLISVGLMTLSTCFMGVLPIYKDVGILAPCLLLASRLIQGLSMCGEEIGAAIYLMESAPNTERCFAGSFVLGGVYVGLLLASLVALVTVSTISSQALQVWGWRIPFLLALPLGLLALVIRLRQPETPAFLSIQSKNQLAVKPLRTVFLNYRKQLLQGMVVSSLLAVMIYLFAVYLPTYIALHHELGMRSAMKIHSASFLIAACVSIGVGYLADRWGHYQLLQVACIGLLIAIYPVFDGISSSNLLQIVFSEFVLAVFMGMLSGSLLPFLINAFPTQLRFSGAAIAFNFSMTLFGSTAPIIFLYLSKYNFILSLAYIVIIIFVTFLSARSLTLANQLESLCLNTL